MRQGGLRPLFRFLLAKLNFLVLVSFSLQQHYMLCFDVLSGNDAQGFKTPFFTADTRPYSIGAIRRFDENWGEWVNAR